MSCLRKHLDAGERLDQRLAMQEVVPGPQDLMILPVYACID